MTKTSNQRESKILKIMTGLSQKFNSQNRELTVCLKEKAQNRSKKRTAQPPRGNKPEKT